MRKRKIYPLTPLMNTQWESCNAQGGKKSNRPRILVLDFLGSENVRNKYFLNHPVYGVLLWQPNLVQGLITLYSTQIFPKSRPYSTFLSAKLPGTNPVIMFLTISSQIPSREEETGYLWRNTSDNITNIDCDSSPSFCLGLLCPWDRRRESIFTVRHIIFFISTNLWAIVRWSKRCQWGLHCRKGDRDEKMEKEKRERDQEKGGWEWREGGGKTSKHMLKTMAMYPMTHIGNDNFRQFWASNK